MARTKNIEENTETNATLVKEDMVPKAKFDELAAKTENLESILSELMSKMNEKNEELKPIPVLESTTNNRMDEIGTLIHLVECDPQLPDNVTIGNKIHYFTTFGEKKSFRWEDLSNFISTHRILFNRGVFALGADCEKFESEIPSDVRILKLPNHFYSNMIELSNDEFKNILSSMSDTQKIQVSLTWRRKYLAKANGYKNIDKMKIINNMTDGSLKDILEEIATD